MPLPATDERLRASELLESQPQACGLAIPPAISKARAFAILLAQCARKFGQLFASCVLRRVLTHPPCVRTRTPVWSARQWDTGADDAGHQTGSPRAQPTRVDHPSR